MKITRAQLKSNIRMEYNSLGSNEEMALFEERLVAGVNEAVAAWQAERGQAGY